MAAELGARLSSVAGVELTQTPVVNSVFATLPADAIDALQKWCFFYIWDELRHEVRWMTAWDTAPADVDAFVAGVAAVLANRAGG